MKTLEKIDFHSHYFPKKYFRVLESKHMSDFGGYRFKSVPSYYDMEKRKRDLSKMGVSIAVLSLGPPGVDFLPKGEAHELAREINNELSNIVTKNPKNYLSLASLPLGDIEASLLELDRSVNDLGMKGAIVFSNVDGRLIAGEEFHPIFERAQKFDIPLMLHPSAPIGIQSLSQQYRHLPLIIAEGFLFDSTLALSRMIFDGVFDKYPKLKIVLPHLGSVIPYILPRIDIETERAGDFLEAYKSPLHKKFAKYFETIYVDTVSHHGPAYKLAIDTVGVERILLGSDYPYSLWDKTVEAIENLHLSKKEKEAIYSRNAKKLLDIKP